jgi:hypothetical protein
MDRRCGWLAAVGALCVPLGAHAANCGNGTQDANAVVMAQHRAYLAHDLDTFAACCADDVVITDPAQEQQAIVSMAALREAYGDFFKRMPAGFRSEYLGRLVNGPRVVASERSVGAKNGATLGGKAMFEVRNGKVIHVWFGPFGQTS